MLKQVEITRYYDLEWKISYSVSDEEQIAGYGPTLISAMQNFDKAWEEYEARLPKND